MKLILVKIDFEVLCLCLDFWIWDLRVNDFVELIGFGGYLVFKMLSELVPSVLYIGHFEPNHQEQERKIK